MIILIRFSILLRFISELVFVLSIFLYFKFINESFVFINNNDNEPSEPNNGPSGQSDSSLSSPPDPNDDGDDDDEEDRDSGFEDLPSDVESQPDYDVYETSDIDHDPRSTMEEDLEQIQEALNGDPNALDNIEQRYPVFFDEVSGNVNAQREALEQIREYLEEEIQALPPAEPQEEEGNNDPSAESSNIPENTTESTNLDSTTGNNKRQLESDDEDISSERPVKKTKNSDDPDDKSNPGGPSMGPGNDSSGSGEVSGPTGSNRVMETILLFSSYLASIISEIYIF
jgi:hypothetical protein